MVEVELPELPQPELHSDLADILLPFRQKREADSRQYSSSPRDVRYGALICPEIRDEERDSKIYIMGGILIVLNTAFIYYQLDMSDYTWVFCTFRSVFIA